MAPTWTLLVQWRGQMSMEEKKIVGITIEVQVPKSQNKKEFNAKVLAVMKAAFLDDLKYVSIDHDPQLLYRGN